MKSGNSLVATIGLPADGLWKSELEDPEDKAEQAEKLMAKAEIAAQGSYEQAKDNYADEIYYIDPSE
jgi:hypothetical protein